VNGLSNQQRWILRPLTDAGLADDEVGTLLLHLAFDGVVDPAGPSPLGVLALAADRPLPVRRAWLEVLDRMTAPDGTAPDGIAPPTTAPDGTGPHPAPRPPA
jgi:hypothetical protein